MPISLKSFLISVLTLIILTSCSTVYRSKPLQSNVTFPPDGRYEVLGRVTLVASQSNAGYTLLVNKAKELYPEADDVVNVIFDEKSNTKTTFFFFTEDTYTYELSGIAIKYTK